MRDIKFRIYFKDEESFMSEPITLEDLLHEDWIEFKNKEETLSLPLKDFRFFYSKNENYEIMEYTGLKDKNGKEIYEGDIVEEVYFNPKFDEQERRYGKYIVKYEEDRCGYVPFACGDGCGCCEYEVINVNNAEVIGNIFDNPDLLEKASD